MKLYVESNFVLELALRQQQSASCRALVDHAARREVALVVPAYSLVEPYEAIRRHQKERRQVKRRMDAVLGQLGRSDAYAAHVDNLAHLMDILVSSASDEDRELRSVIAQVAAVSEIIPLDPQVITESLDCQTEYDLSPQDALVYASVMRHLGSSTPVAESCLLNRDKDFADQGVKEQFESRGCKLLTDFDHGLQFVRSQLELSA